MSNYYDENNDFLEQEYKNEEKNPRLATYEDLNRLVASKVRGSVLWMVFGLVLSGIAGFFVMNAAYVGIFCSFSKNISNIRTGNSFSVHVFNLQSVVKSSKIDVYCVFDTYGDKFFSPFCN